MAFSTSLNASIISTWSDNPISIYREFSGNLEESTSCALDLNDDGLNEISFLASLTGVGFYLLEGTRILGVNYGRSGDLFSSSHLKVNDLIGNDGQIWDTGGYHSIVTRYVPMADQSISSDLNFSNQYYIGLEMTMDNQPHYGWLSIHAPDNRALVSGWAYQSTPHRSIIAGAVPEPSSLFLFIIGAWDAWFSRKERT